MLFTMGFDKFKIILHGIRLVQNHCKYNWLDLRPFFMGLDWLGAISVELEKSKVVLDRKRSDRNDCGCDWIGLQLFPMELN